MKHLSNERGAVPVLTLALMAVLIVVVGVAIYNVSKSHQKTAQKTAATTTTSPTPSTSPKTSASPTATATPTSTPTRTPEATPTPADNLSIQVLDAYRYYTTKYPDNPYAVVDVTLTNTGTSSLPVPVSSFSLRDSTGIGGASFGELSGTTMPNGKIIFGDQILSAGQTVTGGLTFGVLNPNASLYTLSYKNQTFSIDASSIVKQQ